MASGPIPSYPSHLNILHIIVVVILRIHTIEQNVLTDCFIWIMHSWADPEGTWRPDPSHPYPLPWKFTLAGIFCASLGAPFPIKKTAFLPIPCLILPIKKVFFLFFFFFFFFFVLFLFFNFLETTTTYACLYICTYYRSLISMFYISVICSEGHMVDWPSS